MSDLKLMDPTPEELAALAVESAPSGANIRLMREFVASGAPVACVYRGTGAKTRRGGWYAAVARLGLEKQLRVRLRGSSILLVRLDSEATP